MTEPDMAAAQREAAAGIPALLDVNRLDPTNVEAVKATWRAYFALPMWLFVARGTVEQPSPFIVVLDERPTLLVFSDADGAKSAAIALGVPEAEASMILAVPTAGVVDWAVTFVQLGVLDIQVDRQLGGFIAPLQMLPAIRANLDAP